MTADVVTVLAVVAGIIWLGILLVSALRNRGGAEEVSPNLKPGIDDQHLETRRLEGGQKAAIAFSAFLAISLPLYFLGENARQEGFVEEFDEASVERGEHIVEEFACFQCHGPLGSGGSAPFVDPRSGVSVSWEAPSLDDIFYRYEEDEINFWVTFGRGNTPMPAWGVEGGGPMNELQVEDVVNYLLTIQVSQQEVVDEVVNVVPEQISRLANAEATVDQAIFEQAQVVHEIDQAEGDVAVVGPLADRAAELLDGAGAGLDTDGDGLPDATEVELSDISAEVVNHFRVVEPIQLDPETPDAEKVEEGLAAMTSAVDQDPILESFVNRIEAALAGDEISEDSPDTDEDGISDAGESTITGLFADAGAAVIPSELTVIDLDPANPESVSGQPDRRTATSMVGGLETVSINLAVTAENRERIKAQEEAGLEFLIEARERQSWAVDYAGVAEAMEASEEEAERVVGLFSGYCARCHTASFSAGLPFTQEIGSGGMGPALWDGRPVVQFGPEGAEDPDLLVDFLLSGSEAETPYGLNGFGTGRMPAFGAILDMEDIQLLARYLRAGNLNGMQDPETASPEAGRADTLVADAHAGKEGQRVLP
jgi:mono/diheme cytochrome c family protein